MSRHSRRENTLFLAFETCRAHRKALDDVRSNMPVAWKKSPAQDDHISIAFLGPLKNGSRERLIHLVGEFCRAADPVRFSFKSLHLFENAPRDNQSSYPEDMKGSLVAFPDPGNIAYLQLLRRELVLKILVPNNFNHGFGQFQPHNTLARIRHLDQQGAEVAHFINKHGDLKIPEDFYPHLTLFEKNEDSNGDVPKYREVTTFPFRGVPRYHHNGNGHANDHNGNGNGNGHSNGNGHTVIPVEDREALQLWGCS